MKRRLSTKWGFVASGRYCNRGRDQIQQLLMVREWLHGDDYNETITMMGKNVRSSAYPDSLRCIMLPLPQAFYDRSPELVARELLGMWLVSRVQGKLCVGRIVETEAYLSAGDPACHAHRGLTRKNASMFGPPGRAYVYMIHAKWCFNAVTEPRGCGSAVLIRAVEPLRGEQHMQARRQREEPRDWTRGPARLCQAFGIHKVHDGWDLTRGKTLWIAQPKDAPRPVLEVRVTPRIGLSSAQDLPLRYYVSGNQFVSGKAQK